MIKVIFNSKSVHLDENNIHEKQVGKDSQASAKYKAKTDFFIKRQIQNKIAKTEIRLCN